MRIQVRSKTTFITNIGRVAFRFQYRFQVRGVNDEDAGPWSDGTYSYATHPTLPRTPVPPFIEERTLTSIKFAWHAPDGRGTAIVGYVLQVQHTGKEFKLPRSQQWFELIHLLPGNSYYVRVKALNEVGPSEYSDWNSLENSHTLTAKPEKATRPVAISGTWNSIDIETRLPYNNGSPITEVSVQHRWVEAFNKGEWETPLHLSVDERKLDPLITVVEHVESDAYVKMLLEEEKREAEERKKGYNPFKEKKAQLSLSEKLNQVKPEGSKLRIHMSDLNSNTLYEFRVSYKNYMGSGMISEPSHRAKTNAALPPEPPTEFSIIESILVEAEGSDVNSNSALVNFGASFDRQGGAYIVQYVIQCRNITVDKQELEAGTDKANSAAVHYAVFKRSPSNASLENLHFTVKDLMCGHSYQFRIRADNEGRDQGIPDGVYSEWTEELVMPKPVEKEDESEVQSVSTKKESVYVEEADANEDDSDLDIDIDILNQPLPTSRGGEAMSKSKGKTSDALKGKNTTGRSILAANLEPGSYQK